MTSGESQGSMLLLLLLLRGEQNNGSEGDMQRQEYKGLM